MRRRWKVKEGFEEPLAMFLFLGWLPFSIVGQLLTAPHGFGGEVGWGFIAGVAAVWGPALLVAAWFAARALYRIHRTRGLLPIARVTEPVTTDLRSVHADRI